MHLKAVYLLRPTEQNFALLLEEIRNPRFKEYYLTFTNLIDDRFLKRLAEADAQEKVRQVQEMHLDYYIINPDLITLNMPSLIRVYQDQKNWKQSEIASINRVVEGIFSVLVSLRRLPMIRYLASSFVDQIIADSLAKQLQLECSKAPQTFDGSAKCLLIITDRREDPVTPLLFQWTYQAILHEFIGISNNKVDLNLQLEALNEPENLEITEEQQKNIYALSFDTDTFYRANMHTNFGEFADNLKDFIQKIAFQQKKNMGNIQDFQDMQNVIQKMPEFKHESANMVKHVNLSSTVSKQIEERKILTVSELEQDIACKDDKKRQAAVQFVSPPLIFSFFLFFSNF